MVGSKNSRYQGIENVTLLSEPLVHETEKQSVRLMFPEYIERAVLPAKGGGMEITMRDMWIYAVIPVLYCLLFLSVRGGFQKASKWIGENVFSEFEIETAAIRKALIAVFLANIAAALITVSGRMNSTAEEGYLIRRDIGGSAYTENLEVSVSGEEKNVEIVVEPKSYREDEKAEIIDHAAARLQNLVLGGEKTSHINHDINLISSYENTPIVISWITDRPDIIDWEGKICEDIPDSGTEVTLTASIEWGDLTREVSIPLRVYPKELSEKEEFNRQVKNAVEESNSTDNEKLFLPDEINGENVSWRSVNDGQGFVILFVGLMFAVLYLYSRIQNREIEEMKRREALLYDYPHLVGKLVLLLNAGMSMRAAFEKIAYDYRLSRKHGGEKREGFEEVLRLCADMEKGVSEIDAYRNMGTRSKEPKYRTFSTLLVQNMMKGSGELIRQLSRESVEAFEERKKRARILGEQAGTRLMFPMMLMLMVVFAILMVPAMVSFA